jgi:serine/threonine protein kinase
MKKCSSSENVMKYYGLFENENFKVLVLEYCNKGSLFDLIN